MSKEPRKSPAEIVKDITISKADAMLNEIKANNRVFSPQGTPKLKLIKIGEEDKLNERIDLALEHYPTDYFKAAAAMSIYIVTNKPFREGNLSTAFNYYLKIHNTSVKKVSNNAAIALYTALRRAQLVNMLTEDAITSVVNAANGPDPFLD